MSIEDELRTLLHAQAEQVSGDGEPYAAVRRRAHRQRMRALTSASVAALVVIGTAVASSVLLVGGSPHRGTPAVSPSPALPVPSPTVTVTPHTGLTAGQVLQVHLAGFPANSTVALSECPSASSAPSKVCPGAAQYAGIDATGTADTTFTAAPATVGIDGARVACRDQCVLVAIAVKSPTGVLVGGPVATAALSFSQAAPAGLSGASLLDLTWVSTQQGWALATRPCATGSCVVLAHTTDGGASWTTLPAPPATTEGGGSDCAKIACVANIRFASPQVGYLFDPGLLMTTDGGASWSAVPGQQVEALEVIGSRVYRVAYAHGGCPGPCNPTLQVSNPGSSSWRTLVGTLHEPGRSNSAQIVGSGSTVLVALYGSVAGPIGAQADLYRSTDGGASWQQASDPCAAFGPGEQDLLSLAAAPGGFFAGVCGPHSATGAFVTTSTDGGAHWARGGKLPSSLPAGPIAAASPSDLLVASTAIGGGGQWTATLWRSTDGGAHWASAQRDTVTLGNTSIPAWLGFETPQVGRWVSGPNRVWTTTDGGASWQQQSFGG